MPAKKDRAEKVLQAMRKGARRNGSPTSYYGSGIVDGRGAKTALKKDAPPEEKPPEGVPGDGKPGDGGSEPTPPSPAGLFSHPSLREEGE